MQGDFRASVGSIGFGEGRRRLLGSSAPGWVTDRDQTRPSRWYAYAHDVFPECAADVRGRRARTGGPGLCL